MKTLVLAEKPSVGRDIARVLGCKNQTKSCIEGEKYIVSWAMGHLVELADPAAHDPIYREWNAEHLPIIPDRMKHKVIGKTSGQFNTIKSLMHRKDVGALVIATDAGREGELVARWIMRLAGYRGPFSRLWISSQTDKAILDGFNNLKPGRDYDNLMHAAECRAEADWLIGLNVTRALSCTYDTRLSAGRVQTPTLAMIRHREERIRNFIPKPYWLVDADFDGFSASWRGNSGPRMFDRHKVEALAAGLKDADAEVTTINSREYRVPPPLAYDLTALQQEANRSLGYSAKQTLRILQGLYERHKIVSYPRTDSRYLTTDIEATIPDRLKALSSTDFGEKAGNILSSSPEPGKRLFDDSKVGDHHAIIPTEERVNAGRLSTEEKAIWSIIVRRFLAVLSPPHRYLKKTAVIDAGGEMFHISSVTVQEEGWRAVEFKAVAVGDSDGFGKIDDLEKGQKLKIKNAVLRQKQTVPPPHHSEASLLASMENPAAFISDRKLKESIKNGGLGTPATRADIIEKLISNRYLQRSGGDLLLTPAGEELLDLAPDELRSAELTAKWELRLSEIAEGTGKPGAFLSDIRRKTSELVASVKTGGREYKPRDFSNRPCPLCGRMMMPARDRKGREIHVCRSLSCGYEEEPEDGSVTGYGRVSRKERAVTRKMMKEYSDKGPETFTLADMIRMKNKKKSD